MSGFETIENKISYIRGRLSRIKKYQDMPRERVDADDTLKSAIERELYVIAQAVIDLSEAIVAYKNFRKPTTMREGIEILGEEGILSGSFVHEFVKIVGFRNALAHEYGEVSFAVVYDVLKNKLAQVEEFLGYIQQSL